MKYTKGSAFTPLLECINTYKNIWKVRIKICENEDGGVDYVEEEYNYQPSLNQIKEYVTAHYNNMCNDDIKGSLKFGGDVVWLSQENQQNYLRDLNLAKITGGENLPVTYKLGEDEAVYRVFQTIEDLQDFNIQVSNHINNSIQRFWSIKDNIDWEKYKI